jgi:hypothetical protein
MARRGTATTGSERVAQRIAVRSLGLALLAGVLALATTSRAAVWSVPVLDPTTAREIVAGGGSVELAIDVPPGAADFGRWSVGFVVHGDAGWAPELQRGRQQAFCPLGVPLLGESWRWVRVQVDRSDALERVLASGLRIAPLSPPEIMVGEAWSGVPPPSGPWQPASFSCAFAPGQREARWLYGDWNGDGTRTVGKYVPALDAFLLDANGNGLWDGVAGGDLLAQLAIAAGPGEPLVGDWNGDGIDDVGKTVDARAYLDANGTLRWEGRAGGDGNALFAPSIPDAVFVAGDWTGDGRDQLARFEPALGRFLLDANGNGAWDGVAGGDDRVDFPPLGAIQLTDVEPFVDDFDGLPGDGVGQAISGVRAMADFDEDRVFRGNAGGDLDYSPPVLLGPELPLRPAEPGDGPTGLFRPGAD